VRSAGGNACTRLLAWDRKQSIAGSKHGNHTATQHCGTLPGEQTDPAAEPSARRNPTDREVEDAGFDFLPYRTRLLTRPRRAVYEITQRGRDVLAANPQRVDVSVLAQFPELAEFRKSAGPRRRGVEVVPISEEAATPEERIDAAYQELRQALAVDLLERVHTMPPAAFEDLVLDVLHAMGYGDGAEDSRLRTGASGDHGIDGVIREDRLGLDVVYVQAKRWEASVGDPSFRASSVRYKAHARRRASSSRPRPSPPMPARMPRPSRRE